MSTDEHYKVDLVVFFKAHFGHSPNMTKLGSPRAEMSQPFKADMIQNKIT